MDQMGPQPLTKPLEKFTLNLISQAKAGYDPVYGARPLKRLIQNEILDELSLQIIEGKLKSGMTVTADWDGKKLKFI